jgi:DNA sulfur modification protein DndD
MGTIIKSVGFQNFYNYYGSFDENTYQFKEGINIINADNNMGKSKFYNGILWILRNRVYDSDTRKMENADSSYSKMASGKAINQDENFDMGVNITFINDEDKYSVSKKVQFRKNADGWVTNELLEVMQTVDNRDIPVLDMNDKEKIIQKIIPAELMNYALLQGETMEQIVDLSSRNGLSSTIEALAGINNLIEICDLSKDLSQRTKKLFNDKEREINSTNKKITGLIQERETLEARIATTETQIETYKTELSKAKEKKEILEANLMKTKDRERFRGMLKGFENEIKRLKEQKNEKEKNITSMLFSETCPWMLMGMREQISIFDQKRQELTTDIATQKAVGSPIVLPEGSPDVPSLQRMLRTETCEVCGRPAPKDGEHWKHIKMVLERPTNNSNPNRNNFNHFYSSIQTAVGAFALSIPKIDESVLNYREKIDELDDLISEKEDERENARNEFLNAGGSEIGSDNTDKQTIADYTLAEKTIDKKEGEIKKAEDAIKAWNIRLNQIETEINEIGTSKEIDKFRNFKETMSSIEYIFNNAKERIFDEILNSLEINANTKYQELTYGNLSAGGRLNFNKQADGTVQVSIKNVNDGEFTGLGTGFQRMKQLSIIMAIISSKIGNKRFDFPFISDAPFSEFGDNFINNFFAIAPKVFTQSIILIKELYDPKSDSYLNDLGLKVLKKMENSEIPGTFYVNVIKEKADTTNLVTKNKPYVN